jgi:hypothetical protein
MYLKTQTPVLSLPRRFKSYMGFCITNPKLSFKSARHAWRGLNPVSRVHTPETMRNRVAHILLTYGANKRRFSFAAQTGLHVV